jgi:PAS domain S-box-containing protein
VNREPHRQGHSEPTSIRTPSSGPRYWIQTDLAGSIIDLSQATATLLGLSRNRIVGRSVQQFIGQDHHQVMSDMRQAHREGRPVLSDRLVRGRATQGDSWRVQVRRAKEDGELVWILMARASSD